MLDLRANRLKEIPMPSKPRRLEQVQLPLFRVRSSTPRWEDMPANTRTEIVRLLVRLLVQVRPDRTLTEERGDE